MKVSELKTDMDRKFALSMSGSSKSTNDSNGSTKASKSCGYSLSPRARPLVGILTSSPRRCE